MLLDTSGLLALLDAREPLHNIAVEYFHSAQTRVTHAFVLAELIALSSARNVPSSKVLAFVKALIDNPDIETV